MNILDFTPFYPPHVGGVEAYAQELHGELLKRKEISSITVFTPQIPSTAPVRETLGMLTIVRYPAVEIVPNFPLPKFWSLRFWSLLREMRKQKFDLVMAHTRFFASSFLGFGHARMVRLPFVHIEHGSDFVQSGSKAVASIAWIYDQTFGRMVIHGAYSVVAISSAVSQFLLKIYGRESKVIVRGMSAASIDALPSFELPEAYVAKTVICYVGRLIDSKGVAELVRTMILLQDANIVCMLVGDGPQREDLELLVAKLNLKEKVFFLGSKSHDEALSLIKAADIFVNPSYNEGLPTTVLEAALCKTPIIATDVGGTREIISDGTSGFLVQSRDETVLAEKIAVLIASPEKRDAFATSAYAHAREAFNWDACCDSYMEIFKSVTQKTK